MGSDAAPLLFRGGVAEAGDSHCVPLAAQGVPTAPRSAFSCQCYETGLCRGVHRNLKLCFNNRAPALLTAKVIYFAVSSHRITQSHTVDAVLLHFAI